MLVALTVFARVLEKERLRSTGFFTRNRRFASGKDTFSVTLILWIYRSLRYVGHLLELAAWSPSQFTQRAGDEQGLGSCAELPHFAQAGLTAMHLCCV